MLILLGLVVVLLLCTGLRMLLLLLLLPPVLLVLFVLCVGDVVGEILGNKLAIIRSASSGDGGEYLPSGGTGSGSGAALASSVG